MRVSLRWPDAANGSAPVPPGERPAPSEPGHGPEGSEGPPPEVVNSGLIPLHDSDPRSTVGLIVDAYERLGSRLLTRLRDLRSDVDGDLAAVRSELAALRTAVEDVADRVQLRQMRSSVDELRSDVAGLRRAVLEWPELERVAADLSSLRAATAELLEQVARRPLAEAADTSEPTHLPELTDRLAELAHGLGSLSDAVAAAPEPLTPADVAAAVRAELDARPAPAPSRPDLAALAPLVEELVELRSEMEALRRRIALRAATEGPSLGPRDLDAIADAVHARITDAVQPR